VHCLCKSKKIKIISNKKVLIIDYYKILLFYQLIPPASLFAFSKNSAMVDDMSFTYNPKKKKRRRTHGFLKRASTATGNKVLSRRRAKGRKKLAL